MINFYKKLIRHDHHLSLKAYQFEKLKILNFVHAIIHAGDLRSIALAAMMILEIAYYKYDFNLTKLVINVFLIAFIGTILEAVIKIAVRRRRPSYFNFKVYLDANKDIYGFPSGHCLRLAALTTYLVFLKHFYVAFILFVLTLLTCVLRVIIGAHYWLDVLAGSLIGLLLVIIMLQFAPALFYHPLCI